MVARRHLKKVLLLVAGLAGLVLFQNFSYPVFQSPYAQVQVALVVNGQPLGFYRNDNNQAQFLSGTIGISVPLTETKPVNGVLEISTKEAFSTPQLSHGDGWYANVDLKVDVSTCTPRVISCQQWLTAYNVTPRVEAIATAMVTSCFHVALPPATCVTPPTTTNPMPAVLSYVTVNHSTYNLVTGMPAEMGNSYRDPWGLIWGDRAMTSAGQVLQLKHEQAEAYCHNITGGKARLPSVDELIRLRESMSQTPNSQAPTNNSYRIQYPALPHLDELGSDAYWSGTPDLKYPGGEYFLQGIYGQVSSLVDTASLSIRCVVGSSAPPSTTSTTTTTTRPPTTTTHPPTTTTTRPPTTTTHPTTTHPPTTTTTTRPPTTTTLACPVGQVYTCHAKVCGCTRAP